MSVYDYDVVIVGGGIVGLTFANLLRESGLRYAVIEKKEPLLEFDSSIPDWQVVAVNHYSQRVFEKLGVWENIQSLGVSPYYDMHVWDRKGKGDINFSASEIGKENLGHIIEKRVLVKALWLGEAVHCPTQINKLIKTPNGITIECEDKTLNTKLLVAADGAHSWVREELDFSLKKQGYQQSAFVGTVRTEKPHARTAWQVFLPDGTLAFLPLKDPYISSIVWAIKTSCADVLEKKDRAGFSTSITKASQEKLGNVTLESEPVKYPLMERHADVYVKPHVALIGDAAHTIHPLAGQGLNLGIKDANELYTVIMEAYEKQRDISALHTLRKYQRARRADNLITQKAMMGFKHLFTERLPLIVRLRSLGLNGVDRFSALKNLFIRHALG